MARNSNRRRGLLASGLGMCAFALVFGAGAAAAAEPLQLTCEATPPNDLYRSQTIKVQVDFDNQIVKLIEPTGEVIASTTDRRWNALAPSVRITDGAIGWSLHNAANERIFWGQLDRETGEITTGWFGPRATYANAPFEGNDFKGRCRRATQKF